MISHRKKIGSVEIDLVFKTPKGQMVLLEVKSANIRSGMFLSHRWPNIQKNKFKKVLESLICKYPYAEIYGVLALVDYNEISFYFWDEVS